MKAALAAIGIGLATEVALVVALVVGGGIGPCGPGSPMGAAILWLHEPSIRVATLFSTAIGHDVGIVSVPVIYAAFWSLIAYLFLSLRQDQG